MMEINFTSISFWNFLTKYNLKFYCSSSRHSISLHANFNVYLMDDAITIQFACIVFSKTSRLNRRLFSQLIIEFLTFLTLRSIFRSPGPQRIDYRDLERKAYVYHGINIDREISLIILLFLGVPLLVRPLNINEED